MGKGSGWETDYVVSVYPPPPHTIHPPHQIATILEESVIVFRRLRIHYNNIVSLLHGIVQSPPLLSGGLLLHQHSTTKLPESVVYEESGGI